MTKRALHIWLRARPPVWLFLVFFSAGAAGHAQTDPASLPAHDAHEGLLVAANPYTSDEQSKIKFGKHTPFEAGILAIDVYFRNDNDLPIRLNLRTVEMRIYTEFARSPNGSPERPTCANCANEPEDGKEKFTSSKCRLGWLRRTGWKFGGCARCD